MFAQERKAVDEVWQVLQLHVEGHCVSILDKAEPLTILDDLQLIHLN